MSLSTSSTIRIETLLEHEPFVRSILRGLVSDENQVQDLVQETWVRALRRPPKEPGAIKGWLARVAKNLVHDSHRRSATRTHREESVSRPEADTSAATSEERLRLHQQIVDAVMDLDEPYRAVMILTYYEDLSATQIAEKLDRKPATVRSQIHRAHATLRTKLDADYGSRGNWMLIATPMLKWNKPAAAKATGFTLVQIASYAAVAVCLVGAGIWIESLLSNPDEAVTGNSATESVVDLHSPEQDASHSIGTAAMGNASNKSGEFQAANSESGEALINDALATGSNDTKRTLPLMDWSVRVIQDGKPVEGVPVFLRLELDGAEMVSSKRAVDMGFASPRSGVDQTWLGFYSWSDPTLAKATTASNGIATFSLASLPRMLWALTDTASIVKAVEAGSGHELQVELLPGFAIHVQVVDGEGEPITGVPILGQMSIAPEGEQYGTGMENTRFDLAWTESEGPKGRAVFYYQGEPGGPAPGAEDGQNQYFAVRLGIPGQNVRTRHIRKGQGSSIKNPVRLVMPSTGSLKVRILEPDGAVSDRPGRVLLSKDLKYDIAGEIQSYADVVDGVAHFPIVAIGGQYEMTFHSPQTGVQWETTAQGPVAPNEQAVRVIQGTFAPSIRGQISSSAGPFGDWSKAPALYLCVLDSERKEIQRVEFWPKSDGSFDVSLDPKKVGGLEVSLQIVGFHWTKDMLRPRWDGEGKQALGAGTHDLGKIDIDWILDRVRGQVVGMKGKPVKGAWVSAGLDRWKSSASVETDSKGNFVLQGVFPDRTHLTVSESWGAPEQRIEVRVGEDKPLRIVLKTYAKMKGKLVAPRNGNGNYYQVQVVHSDPELKMEQQSFSGVDQDTGRFEVVGISEGTHSVLVKLGKATILEIPSVSFKKGKPCVDPRVAIIELSDHMSTWVFKVQDLDGKALPRVSCSIAGPDGHVAHVNTDRMGEAQVALPNNGSWKLRASQQGLRAGVLEFSGVPSGAPLVLKMKRGIAVRLACQQDPVMEKSGQRAQLSLGLLNAEGDLVGGGSSVSLSKYLYDQKNGQVMFPAPGKYVLLLSKRTMAPPGGMVMASVATRCKFSDFVLEVKESDEGKTLDLILPDDLFQE
ncbi:MAG: RNA polymerase sigma factor (sigma-70 family) [Planctomycetota bacterium]|jgi:RNA polymerase sigma factor (sigma-70 family)